MKIKFTKNGMGIGLAYFKDDTTDLPQLQAKEIIEMGFAEAYQPALEEQTEVADLPADFPGRAKLVKAKFSTFKSLEVISDFTDIKGIGPALAKQIEKHLNDA